MKRINSRTAILEASYSLMLAQGYAATSVDDICRQAGVSKGSFYHFFPTKQDCALAMIDHHMLEAEQTIQAGLDLEGLDPSDAAIAYVEHIESLSEVMFENGCLIGAFALELAETHPELREQVSTVFRGTTAEFEKVLAPLCEASTQSDTPTPRELAEQMMSVIEGGVVLSKAHNDRRYVSQSLRLFRKYLGTLRTN